MVSSSSSPLCRREDVAGNDVGDDDDDDVVWKNRVCVSVFCVYTKATIQKNQRYTERQREVWPGCVTSAIGNRMLTGMVMHVHNIQNDIKVCERGPIQ